MEIWNTANQSKGLRRAALVLLILAGGAVTVLWLITCTQQKKKENQQQESVSIVLKSLLTFQPKTPTCTDGKKESPPYSTPPSLLTKHKCFEQWWRVFFFLQEKLSVVSSSAPAAKSGILCREKGPDLQWCHFPGGGVRRGECCRVRFTTPCSWYNEEYAKLRISQHENKTQPLLRQPGTWP